MVMARDCNGMAVSSMQKELRELLLHPTAGPGGEGRGDKVSGY
jgi:hypothetical protein